MGTFINAISNSNLTVYDSTFVNGMAKTGGAIYITGGNHLSVLQF